MSRGRSPLARALAPRWFGFYILIAMVVGFSIALPDSFPTTANFRAIAGNQAIGAILAIALILPLAAGAFDLSLASVMTLTSVVAAGMFHSLDAPVVVAVLAAVVVGTIFGVVNGVGVAVIGIDSLIVTLATGSVATGVAQWWTNGSIFTDKIPQSFQDIGQRQPAGIPLPVIYMAVIGIVVWWVLERTPVGRYVYALGDNHEAARLTGLRTSRLTVGSFTIAGALAGLAGVVLSAKTGSGNPTIGASFLLPAFAAAFLGATIFRPGQYNIVGTVVAVFIVAIGLAGLTQLGVAFYIEPVFTGVVLFVAVALTKFQGWKRIVGREKGIA
jgi:ribose transport system permease protein